MKSAPSHILAENRRARFDYEILDTLEAGIELLGFEVKSVKKGQMGLHGSYAVIQGQSGTRYELKLLNAQIPPYQPGNTPKEYNPSRTRRLLLKGGEVAKLAGKVKEKYVIIPLEARLRHGLVKVILGIARPRKKGDRREYIKKRDAQIEMRKEF